MTRVGFVLFVLLLMTGPGHSQAAQQRPTHDTWYDRAFRQLNPDNTDFGSIFEQRKRAFIDWLGTPCVQFGFVTFTAFLLSVTVVCVQRVSHKRTLEIAIQSLADVLRHDHYSRKVAHDAIQHYNDHIEACNRVIEAGEEGLQKSMSAEESERMRQELTATREENKALRKELSENSKIISGMTPPPADQPKQPVQTQMQFVPGQYVEQINLLQKQIREEQRKNQNLKGTSVNDHRA